MVETSGFLLLKSRTAETNVNPKLLPIRNKKLRNGTRLRALTDRIKHEANIQGTGTVP